MTAERLNDLDLLGPPRSCRRLPVQKTYKLYIGGAFPRSESGRTYEAEGANVARASRKDLRDARATLCPSASYVLPDSDRGNAPPM